MSYFEYALLGFAVGILLALIRPVRAFLTGWENGYDAADSEWLAAALDACASVERDGRHYVVTEVTLDGAPVEDDSDESIQFNEYPLRGE